MNYTKIMLGGIVALSSTAFAMPTSEQTKKVEPLVVDLMRDDQAALKSGKKTRVEVAESAMSLADQAESEAAKLLLMKGAFNLYVRAGEFDKAIETLQSLQAAIPDIPPSNMANIIETSLRSVPRKNGGQLYRLLDETKTRMRYTNEAASLEKSVKKTPADRTLRLKLAEHYAYLGKWDLALENFVAAEGKVGAIAKSERGGEAATEKIADFWWDYPNGKADELVRGFRVHAAKLYEDAIAAGAIKGLNKVQAERRIEEAKEFGETIFVEKENLPLKGLAHRWSFDNGLNDSIGKVNGQGTNVVVKQGKCFFQKGSIALDAATPPSGTDFTIEIWYTELSRTYGARVFILKGESEEIIWATGEPNEGFFAAGRNTSRGTDCIGFDLGAQTYIAVTCHHENGHYKFVAYKHDLKNGKLETFEIEKDGIASFERFCLGGFCAKNVPPIAEYDETRIWNRALTQKEIEVSIRKGPNAVIK